MSSTTERLISPEVIESAMSYTTYRQLIDRLLEKEKTTGDDHSEAMVNYTKMNAQRMKRLDNQVHLSDDLTTALQQVDKEWIWLVLTEGWCGDAAQNVPVIAKMADQNENIDLKLILRDQHLDIMDEYLTNGGRAIPKLVCLDAETLEEVGSWGPRPGKLQQLAMEWKDDPEISQEEWGEKLHKWYAEDKTHAIQADFIRLVDEWK